jgi:hypothetical protein
MEFFTAMFAGTTGEAVATAEVPQGVLEAVAPMGVKKAIRDLLVAATVAALANPGAPASNNRCHSTV